MADEKTPESPPPPPGDKPPPPPLKPDPKLITYLEKGSKGGRKRRK
jgi:hypothetical protein